jgi:hypothetical protein
MTKEKEQRDKEKKEKARAKREKRGRERSQFGTRIEKKEESEGDAENSLCGTDNSGLALKG